MPSFRLPQSSSHPFFSDRPSPDPAHINDGVPSTDGRSSLKKVRRKTAHDTAVSRLAESEFEVRGVSNKDPLEAGATPRLVLRSRPSWVKRLSAMSSLESSPASSPRPDSPNTLVRHTSPAYSHSGSTVPIITGARTSSASPSLPPNKLVKRSSSQHLSEYPKTNTRFPSLRRPATSHQRATTLHEFPYTLRQLDQAHEVTQPHRPYTPSDPRWKHFFSIKVSAVSSKGRKRTLPADGEYPTRRIVPEAGCIPHLVSADVAITNAIEIDELYDVETSSTFMRSRPTSSYFGSQSFVLPSKSRPTANGTTHSTPRDPEEAEPRKSFGLGELLSFGPGKHQSALTRSSSRTKLRQSARRVFSDPLSGLGISRSSNESEHPTKRRDISGSSTASRSYYSNHRMNLDPRSSAMSDDLLRSPIDTSSTANSYRSMSTNASPDISQATSFFQEMSLDGDHSTIESYHKSSRDAGLDRTENTIFTSSTFHAATRFLQPGNPGSQLAGSTNDSKRNRGGHSGQLQSTFETIYDESPPRKVVGTEANNGQRQAQTPKLNMDEEDLDIIATPGRTIRSDKADDGSPVARRLRLRAEPGSPLPSHRTLPSSPPDAPKPLSLGTLEYDDDEEASDGTQNARWPKLIGANDDSDNDSLSDWSTIEGIATPLPLPRSKSLLIGHQATNSDSSDGASRSNDGDYQSRDSKTDPKSAIFDFAEQASDKPSSNRSPPRPRTVHGKKVMDPRGSRTNGRRMPPALHIRSQSVPVVPDVAGIRETVVTNKFGTWGVGSKGISEDWDGDFDFGEESDQSDDREERRIDSGIAMHIPQIIRDQAINVVNNIGLVKELKSAVEELKDLRNTADFNGFLEPPRAPVWDRVDGMIDLADQEAEDAGGFGLSPPSSPGFNSEAFDESADNSMVDLNIPGPSVPVGVHTPQRLSLVHEFAAFQTAGASPLSLPSASKPVTTRPRSDSEAVARSVIEALKQRNTVNQPLDLRPVPRGKKVPFDTNTLRHIVPYVKGLVREVQKLMQTVENMDLDEDQSTVRITSSRGKNAMSMNDAPATPQDYPLRKLFQDPLESPSHRAASTSQVRPKTRTIQSDDSIQSVPETRQLATNFMTLM